MRCRERPKRARLNGCSHRLGRGESNEFKAGTTQPSANPRSPSARRSDDRGSRCGSISIAVTRGPRFRATRFLQRPLDGARLVSASQHGAAETSIFSAMASNRVSAAFSVLTTRKFLQDFLLARRALEFSHSLGHERTSGPGTRCLLNPGGLNRSTQHFILKGKDGVCGDRPKISSRFHCGREDGVVGSLAAG